MLLQYKMLKTIMQLKNVSKGFYTFISLYLMLFIVPVTYHWKNSS